MGTIARLNTAKKKLAQAEQAMPRAYQNNYTDSINQKLGQLADASLTGSTGVDTDALNAAYQQYRANSVANAQNGAQPLPARPIPWRAGTVRTGPRRRRTRRQGSRSQAWTTA